MHIHTSIQSKRQSAMKKNKRAYKLSPAAIAQRRAASKIAGEKRRKGPRKSVSLRADAADILRDAAKNRGLSKSEVIRRDVIQGTPHREEKA